MYYKVKDETIEDIAEAIKVQSGITGDLKVEDFAQTILSLELGEDTEAAAKSASEAKSSALSAQTSAFSASESAGFAANSAIEAKASLDIIDGRGERAIISAEKAEESNLDSEAWANGTRNGIDVVEGDIAYHNNAKYWFQQTHMEEFTEEEFQNIWDDIFMQEVSE